jgi:hypothetical protein
MLQAGSSPVRVSDEENFFNLPNPSSRTMSLGSTQPLTEMSSRNLPTRPARRANNRAAICEPNIWKCGTSTSHNPKGLHGLYRDNFLPLPYSSNTTTNGAQRRSCTVYCLNGMGRSWPLSRYYRGIPLEWLRKRLRTCNRQILESGNLQYKLSLGIW